MVEAGGEVREGKTTNREFEKQWMKYPGIHGGVCSLSLLFSIRILVKEGVDQSLFSTNQNYHKLLVQFGPVKIAYCLK